MKTKHLFFLALSVFYISTNKVCYAEYPKVFGVGTLFNPDPISTILLATANYAIAPTLENRWIQEPAFKYRHILFDAGLEKIVPVNGFLTKYRPDYQKFRDNFTTEYGYFAKFAFLPSEKDDTPTLNDKAKDYISSELYLMLSQSKLNMKSEVLDELNLNSNDLNTSAYLEAIKLGMTANPDFLRTKYVHATFELGYSLGLYRFRFEDEETFNTIGGQTYTELRHENDKINLGFEYTLGFNVILGRRILLNCTGNYAVINSRLFTWKQTILQPLEFTLVSIPSIVLQAIPDKPILNLLGQIGYYATFFICTYNIEKNGKILWTESRHHLMRYFYPKFSFSIMI